MADLDVLFDGYVGERVAGTVSLVRDGDVLVVVDPGMVPDRDRILAPLERRGITPEAITDVVISHHHPDHTMNIALFPEARLHDHWATYRGDVWTSRPAEGVRLSPGISLIETPGHTSEDITTLVETEQGVAALTHLWWTESAASDPLAEDLEGLHAGRRRVLERAALIVPGHGPAFRVTDATPR